MTLEDFLKLYNGNAAITIEGYCDEEPYDYVTPPRWFECGTKTEEPYGNRPSCIFKEQWWEDVKDREVYFFSITGGETHKAELFISLE